MPNSVNASVASTVAETRKNHIEGFVYICNFKKKTICSRYGKMLGFDETDDRCMGVSKKKFMCRALFNNILPEIIMIYFHSRIFLFLFVCLLFRTLACFPGLGK